MSGGRESRISPELASVTSRKSEASAAIIAIVPPPKTVDSTVVRRSRWVSMAIAIAWRCRYVREYRCCLLGCRTDFNHMIDALYSHKPPTNDHRPPTTDSKRCTHATELNRNWTERANNRIQNVNLIFITDFFTFSLLHRWLFPGQCVLTSCSALPYPALPFPLPFPRQSIYFRQGSLVAFEQINNLAFCVKLVFISLYLDRSKFVCQLFGSFRCADVAHTPCSALISH